MTVVGVAPGAALTERPRLFAGLEAILPVRFEPLDAVRQPAAVLAFGPLENVPAPVLSLSAQAAADTGNVVFGGGPGVDPRLRGARLPSDWAPLAGGEHAAGAEVLAAVDGVPAWIALPGAAPRELVGSDLPELGEGEVLRDRIVPGRCLGLIAVLQFLRAACADELWSPARLGANFLFDDPNVRFGRYGYVDFRELAADAARHEYTVSFAHVPLDFRFSRGSVIADFAEQGSRLSLAVHGNNHAYHELEAPASAVAADRLVAQALRRVERFERRSGVAVSRVMVPPHEACSEPVIAALARFGFEAVTLTRPFSWSTELDHSSPFVVPGARPGGFDPADVSAHGMPLITRRDFVDLEEVAIRSFLDLPLLFYGHEGDLSGGLDVLRDAAAAINAQPRVEWCDLAGLARGCYRIRRTGSVLEVRPFARRLDVDVPPGVETVVVHPLLDGEVREVELEPAGEARRIRVDLAPPAADPAGVSSPGVRLDAIARRIAGETRDRIHPLRDRVRR